MIDLTTPSGGRPVRDAGSPGSLVFGVGPHGPTTAHGEFDRACLCREHACMHRIQHVGAAPSEVLLDEEINVPANNVRPIVI
jgi:hypothetical protein